MQSPSKSWETNINTLQNSGQILRNSYSGIPTTPGRSVPVLPPRPQSNLNNYGSYSPYSSYGSSYGGFGYNSYGSLPYRNSPYGNYGSYGGYGGYGMGPYTSYSSPDDTERRFIQFAEERSRHTFSNIENIVRAVNSLSMMLDNTFFAITSSFRAVLSVAENFGRLRSVFGQIWYSLNIFRLFNWLYKKILYMFGKRTPSNSIAWKEAAGTSAKNCGGSSLSTIAFLGVLFSAPYLINKLLPKYEDKSNPENWKTPGVKAKAAFDFVATAPNELSLTMNDEIQLAPTYIQEEMNLTNTGWAFAVCRGKSGTVPLNYLILANTSRNRTDNYVPIPRDAKKQGPLKSSLKKVSFGETQIFQPSDLDSYVKIESDEAEKSKELDSKKECDKEVSIVNSEENVVEEDLSKDSN